MGEGWVVVVGAPCTHDMGTCNHFEGCFRVFRRLQNPPARRTAAHENISRRLPVVLAPAAGAAAGARACHI